MSGIVWALIAGGAWIVGTIMSERWDVTPFTAYSIGFVLGLALGAIVAAN